LVELPVQFGVLFEAFKKRIFFVQKTAEETLSGDDLTAVLMDLTDIEEEISSNQKKLILDVKKCSQYFQMEGQENKRVLKHGLHWANERNSQRARRWVGT
jgi:hypothetical protein